MKKSKYYLLVILLLVFNFILIFKLNICSTKESGYNSQSNVHYIQVLKKTLKSVYKTNGKLIPKIQIKNLLNEDILSNNIISNKRLTIIFLYSEVTCNICVDSLIQNCNNLKNSLDSDSQIFGIAYSDDINYLRRFVRINKLNFPVLWDKNNLLSTQLKIEKLPAILVVNREGVVINSFFMDTLLKDLVEKFFNSIDNRI